MIASYAIPIENQKRNCTLLLLQYLKGNLGVWVIKPLGEPYVWTSFTSRQIKDDPCTGLQNLSATKVRMQLIWMLWFYLVLFRGVSFWWKYWIRLQIKESKLAWTFSFSFSFSCIEKIWNYSPSSSNICHSSFDICCLFFAVCPWARG